MSWKNYAKWYKQKDAWQRAPMKEKDADPDDICLLYTSPSPRDLSTSRMPSSA